MHDRSLRFIPSKKKYEDAWHRGGNSSFGGMQGKVVHVGGGGRWDHRNSRSDVLSWRKENHDAGDKNILIKDVEQLCQGQQALSGDPDLVKVNAKGGEEAAGQKGAQVVVMQQKTVEASEGQVNSTMLGMHTDASMVDRREKEIEEKENHDGKKRKGFKRIHRDDHTSQTAPSTKLGSCPCVATENANLYNYDIVIIKMQNYSNSSYWHINNRHMLLYKTKIQLLAASII